VKANTRNRTAMTNSNGFNAAVSLLSCDVS
jgi:hypothetical protein